jgi:thioredoxin-dependent peroxiredoxin
MQRGRRGVILLVGGTIVLVLLLFVEEKAGILDVGTRAPAFSARLTNGSTVTLTEFIGKKNIVLFFYPQDFTAGCTAQACALRDGYAEIVSHNAVVFGVSADNSASHSSFRETHNLPFDLIADTNRILIRSYGVERAGGFVRLPKRVTYVIDMEGIIRLAAHHEIAVSNHLYDVLATLRELEPGYDQR